VYLYHAGMTYFVTNLTRPSGSSTYTAGTEVISHHLTLKNSNTIVV